MEDGVGLKTARVSDLCDGQGAEARVEGRSGHG
jgi:hypothetical protein